MNLAAIRLPARNGPRRAMALAAALAAVLALACTPPPPEPAGPPPARPSFLVIVADDLGPTDLGFMGSEIHTPHIDRLARQGLLLPRFLVSPACSPTRAMLLTGMEPHAVGLGTMAGEARGRQVGAAGYEGVLSESVETVATRLRRAGYHTSLAGKWHLGGAPGQLPDRRGFERWFGIAGGGASHFADGLALTPPEQKATYYLDGEPVDLPPDFFSTRSYTDRLMEFIAEAAAEDRPFFALAAYTAPHWPLQAPDEWIERYAGTYDDGWDALRARRHEAAVTHGLVPAAPPPPRNLFAPAWRELGAHEREVAARKMEVYAAMVENLDHHVGRLVDLLERRHLLEETIVLFFSDNGPEGNPVDRLDGIGPWVEERFDNSLANIGRVDSYTWTGPGWAQASAAPYRLFKTFPTEGGVRAPAVVHGPVARRGRSDAVVSVMDVAPTLLELAGEPVPPGMSGRSMAAFLERRVDRVHAAEEAFGSELFGRRSMRRGRWKATWLWPPYGPGAWQLYDLQADPGERRDLATEQPDRLAALVAAWEAWAAASGVVLPDSDAGYALEAAPVASAGVAVGSSRLSQSQHSRPHEDALDRLLAHRVRGFDHPEGSIPALEAALEAGVAYVEIDTRVTKDRRILVYHDATLATYTTSEELVLDYDLERNGPPVFKKGPPNYKEADDTRPDVEVPTLEQFLDVFAARGGDTVLQVDLKDPLEEVLHADLIRQAGVGERTWVISWYPEALMRVHAHDPGLRLGLSHLPLPRLASPLAGLGRLLAGSGLIDWIGKRYGDKHPNLKGLELYFNDEQPRAERAATAGRFPMHVLTRLPQGELLEALRASRGGVGLHSKLLRRSYVRAARAAGLRTFVYTIEDPDRYLAAVRDKDPDIIFSDQAAAILDKLRGAGEAR